MIKVTIFNEYAHERLDEKVKEIYPKGIHSQLASFLGDDDIELPYVSIVNHLVEFHTLLGGSTSDTLVSINLI